MTAYVAKVASQTWESQTQDSEPSYESHIFEGAQAVPIHGIWAVPPNPKGTIIGTYGITGDLENQWFLRILGRKAIAAGYAVVLFDWRAHGKTAVLSPTLTSDGLYEGEDFVHIASQAKALGCPAPFWFTGYSLGGQLALWGIKAAQTADPAIIDPDDIQGGAVICPSLDSERSLRYLTASTSRKGLPILCKSWPGSCTRIILVSLTQPLLNAPIAFGALTKNWSLGAWASRLLRITMPPAVRCRCSPI